MKTDIFFVRNIKTELILLLCFLSLNVVTVLTAGSNKDSLEVNIRGTNRIKYLAVTVINNREYCALDKIAELFETSVRPDYPDNRITLNIYDEAFIFLMDTAYFSFKNADYKMVFSMLTINGENYLPLSFVTDLLPKFFPDKVVWKDKKLTIKEPATKIIRTIVIDPGHGGKDPGAIGRSLRAQEKDINLAVSLMLKEMLEKEMGVKVLLTRSDDRFVSLQSRTKFANENKADLFISIHTNASRDINSKGVELYYLSTAKTTEARAVEALENSVVEIYEGGKEAVRKYDGVDIILSDMLQAENLEHSSNLAQKLQTNICAGTSACNRGIKQANFYVLRGAFMPAVLVEMGFISNATEEAFLVNRQYQERLARTMFEGIKSFKNKYDRIMTS
ncbi:MAG: N-acetylmuramoyl-L-alanine amidase [Candidatus Cloacimonadaceae bacterium]